MVCGALFRNPKVSLLGWGVIRNVRPITNALCCDGVTVRIIHLVKLKP